MSSFHGKQISPIDAMSYSKEFYSGFRTRQWNVDRFNHYGDEVILLRSKAIDLD